MNAATRSGVHHREAAVANSCCACGLQRSESARGRDSRAVTRRCEYAEQQCCCKRSRICFHGGFLELENRKASAVGSITRRRKFRPCKPARARNRRSGFHTRLASALPRGIFARNPLVGRYRSRGCVPLTPQVSLAQPPNSVLSGGGVKTAIVPLR